MKDAQSLGSCFQGFKELCQAKAQELKAQEPAKKPTGSEFHQDDQGRDFITLEELQAINRQDDLEKAFALHGGDMKKRLAIGGFPVAQDKIDFATLDNVHPSDQQKEMLESIKVEEWVYAFGESGTGKTVAAMRIAAKWMSQDITRKACFVSVADWINGLFRNMDFRDSVVDSDIEKFSRCGLIVIDDLDKFKPSDWVNLQMYRLIDSLYRQGVKVIFSANRSLETLENRQGSNEDTTAMIDRIKGRIGDKGPILFDYKSLR